MRYKYLVDYEDGISGCGLLEFVLYSDHIHGTYEFKEEVRKSIISKGIEPIGRFGSLLLKNDGG